MHERVKVERFPFYDYWCKLWYYLQDIFCTVRMSSSCLALLFKARSSCYKNQCLMEQKWKHEFCTITPIICVRMSIIIYNQSDLFLCYDMMCSVWDKTAPRGGWEEPNLVFQENIEVSLHLTSEVCIQGTQEGGMSSYCLIFFGTSRPVSKVTWREENK